MAKTYLETARLQSRSLRGTHDVPMPTVVLVDSARSVGGTWAAERLYPGLKTNNVVGSYEFSDFPLDLDRYGLKPGQHIPGAVVHRYLNDCAHHFELSHLIRLQTRVDAAALRHGGDWLVDYCATAGAGRQRGQLVASRLVLATGLTSAPNIPSFPGQPAFRGTIFHARHLGEHTAHLASARSVVVLGGNKSAWDACYSACKAGAQVHMVMRPTGGGPSWVWRHIRLWPLVDTTLSRLSLTRAATWFDPSPFGSVGTWARWLVHRTCIGRRLCSAFWAFLDQHVSGSNGYDGDARVGMMRPWTSTFWMGNSLSTHNYETDWFQLVRDGRIIPHIATVASLHSDVVRLSDGNDIKADTLVLCTGWKVAPAIDFLPEPIVGQLRSNAIQDDQEMDAIHREILSQCPVLRRSPERRRPQGVTGNVASDEVPDPSESMLPLYRFMVPTSKPYLESRTLAFIGVHLSVHTVMLAQAQALWITAFFQDRIPTARRPSHRLQHEARFHAEYERLRRPRVAGGAGARCADLVFDSLPYCDMLLEDLGLAAARKSSMLQEALEPYTLADYRGLVQEWVNTHNSWESCSGKS